MSTALQHAVFFAAIVVTFTFFLDHIAGKTRVDKWIEQQPKRWWLVVAAKCVLVGTFAGVISDWVDRLFPG